ncbi:hypothetical protein M8J76_015027 [Diaphorina citri]|nr:hypothetical protein M8J76_015027 [Diaphorina citri]
MKRYRLPSLLDHAGPPGDRFGPPPGPFGRPRMAYGSYYEEDYNYDYGPPSRYPRRVSPQSHLPPPSPFLRRAMLSSEDYAQDVSSRPSKEEILMDLGKSVISSLKGGQKLSENPEVREKIESLLKVEEMDTDTTEKEAPPLPASHYDSYYENFVPPAPRGFPPSRPPVGPGGFPASRPPAGSGGFPPRFPLPSAGHFPDGEENWYNFHRIGQEHDFNRIYASERELSKYFKIVESGAPVRLFGPLKTRLKNTFSFEISQCKFTPRRNWLITNYNKIKNAGDPKATVQIVQIDKEKIKKRQRNETAWAKEKKKLRDKRPPQSIPERRITNYLKSLLFELCGEEEKEHAILMLRAIGTNPNMIKCLMNDCKIYMDKNFGESNDLVTSNKKRSFLIAHHSKHMEETRKQLLELNRSVKDIDDTIYEKYDALLSGKTQDPAAFATPEDYILEPNKTDEEFIVDFKYEFVRFAFEKFFFKIVESFCVTKDRRRRINFFMNNGFVAEMIVMASQNQPVQLPAMAKKYITDMDRPCREAAVRIDGKLLDRAKKTADYLVQTDPEEYCKSDLGIAPLNIEKFKQCVKLFDEKASVIRIQLVDYTPYIRMSREHKIYVFGEIMKFVYLQCMDIVIKARNPHAKEYTDMTRDDADSFM